MQNKTTLNLIKFNKNKKGKTFEQIYGEEKAKEIREKLKKNHKGMLGKKHNKETKIKMSKAPIRKTKEYSEKMRLSKLGSKNPMFNKKLSDDHKEKIRKASIKNRTKPPVYYGENHPQWRGGWKKYYGSNWNIQKNLARERDNHICQICGKKETVKAHDVHHKIPFRKFGKEKYLDANELNNLITLCPSCHTKIESRRKHNK